MSEGRVLRWLRAGCAGYCCVCWLLAAAWLCWLLAVLAVLAAAWLCWLLLRGCVGCWLLRTRLRDLAYELAVRREDGEEEVERRVLLRLVDLRVADLVRRGRRGEPLRDSDLSERRVRRTLSDSRSRLEHAVRALEDGDDVARGDLYVSSIDIMPDADVTVKSVVPASSVMVDSEMGGIICVCLPVTRSFIGAFEM